jgi:hypothetical protein
MKDLIALVADKNMQFSLHGGLSRPESLGIRSITFDFRQHPNRDGGARTTGVQMLALEKARFDHALLVLDYEGSGTTARDAQQLESELNEELAGTWGGRGKAVVIEPELETWMWGSDNSMAVLLGWTNHDSIRNWLQAQGHALNAEGKPERPKEALEAVLRHCKRPRSSVLYQQIASKISLRLCKDASFQRLAERLRTWFPPGNAP